MAEGLAPRREALDNGAVLITRRTTTTPAVSINMAVRAGSAADPVGEEGTTWLLSRVIDRGTATRSADAIAEELDGRGIAVNVTVTRHLFSLVCTCLAEDFDAVFALLAEIVSAPSLAESEVEKRKGEVVTSIRQDDDNPAVRATEGLMALLYPQPHPYGRRTKGSIPFVETLTREKLARLHRDRFAPSELTAVVVGDVDPSRVREVAGRVLAGWQNPPPPAIHVSSPPPVASRRRVLLPMMNKAQADIAYGFAAMRRSDPDYYAAWLMNNALGQYALGGRLGDSIRERQGMAYYVSSALDANAAEGPLMVRAGVGSANVDRTIASIDEELALVRNGGITSKELEDSRTYLIGSIPRALETNAAIANFLQTAEFFGLGEDYDVRLPGLLRGVTLDAVHAVARRLLDPDRATIVVAGPYENT